MFWTSVLWVVALFVLPSLAGWHGAALARRGATGTVLAFALGCAVLALLLLSRQEITTLLVAP